MDQTGWSSNDTAVYTEVMLDHVSVNNYPQFVEFTAVMSYVWSPAGHNSIIVISSLKIITPILIGQLSSCLWLVESSSRRSHWTDVECDDYKLIGIGSFVIISQAEEFSLVRCNAHIVLSLSLGFGSWPAIVSLLRHEPQDRSKTWQPGEKTRSEETSGAGVILFNCWWI